MDQKIGFTECTSTTCTPYFIDLSKATPNQVYDETALSWEKDFNLEISHHPNLIEDWVEDRDNSNERKVPIETEYNRPNYDEITLSWGKDFNLWINNHSNLMED